MHFETVAITNEISVFFIYLCILILQNFTLKTFLYEYITNHF